MDVTENDGFVSLADIDWTCGNETADTIYLQWNEGWGIWEQVIDEAANRSGVVKWQRATTAQSEAAELRKEVERLRGVLRQCAEAPHSGWTIAQALARAALKETQHEG